MCTSLGPPSSLFNSKLIKLKLDKYSIDLFPYVKSLNPVF